MPEPAHHEPVIFVDHPHPGQEGDFDDEVPVTLPGKKGKEWNKDENHYSHSAVLFRFGVTIMYTCLWPPKYQCVSPCM